MSNDNELHNEVSSEDVEEYRKTKTFTEDYLKRRAKELIDALDGMELQHVLENLFVVVLTPKGEGSFELKPDFSYDHVYNYEDYGADVFGPITDFDPVRREYWKCEFNCEGMGEE